MKLKKLISAFMAVAITGSMLVGCGSTTTTTTQTEAAKTTEAAKETSDNGAGQLTGEPIKIGAMYALSGDKAAIGTNIMRGVDFAAAEINAAGGVNGRPIEIVRGDT